ncbi:hypothetical protein [Pseudomonas sp. P105]|uniref:hypothetical protein n=1 Tax=Pseudomonas sp. P105 TaxID=3049542 RepID=UPI0029347E49|nr:hypothetical protein [Pseudomonas sp. P105]WNZ81379.1 hypothetical protein QOM08_28585 [Pseudomonas sp. P105]
MKKTAHVFILMLTPVALASAETMLPAFASAAISDFQMKLLSFGAWMLAGATLGAVLARNIDGQRRGLRKALFLLCLLGGGSMGMLGFLGKIPW